MTRAQMVLMMHRYSGMKGFSTASDLSVLDQFSDKDDLNPVAAEAMSWGVANGLITGNDGNLLPNMTITRGQVVLILHRFVNAFVGPTPVPQAIATYAGFNNVPDFGAFSGAIEIDRLEENTPDYRSIAFVYHANSFDAGKIAGYADLLVQMGFRFEETITIEEAGDVSSHDVYVQGTAVITLVSIGLFLDNELFMVMIMVG